MDFKERSLFQKNKKFTRREILEKILAKYEKKWRHHLNMNQTLNSKRKKVKVS